MPTDFRDGNTFPRRGREMLGGYLWLARVLDKARAKANQTQDGYIYPCPMDRAVMSRWCINPSEFTAGLTEHQSDDSMLEWLGTRVTPDRMQAANAWVLQQTYSLDRQDAEERVSGATSPGLNWRELGIGIATAIIVLLTAFILRRVLHI
jgi:Domain of unknown function (DUF5069)